MAPSHYNYRMRESLFLNESLPNTLSIFSETSAEVISEEIDNSNPSLNLLLSHLEQTSINILSQESEVFRDFSIFRDKRPSTFPSVEYSNY